MLSLLTREKSGFQSWGHYPRLEAEVKPLNWVSDFLPAIPPDSRLILPVGLGRSYGDSCLLDHGRLLDTRGLKRLLAFDARSGLLRCEAGVTLAAILDFAVPRGWFLPVTPGTKYVTVGGAIANDIHGKNHHIAGAFGLHTPQFEVLRSDGSRRICSSTQNPELYRATIGGLGLTGLISWAEVQLRPIVSRKIDYESIRFRGLEEFLALSHDSAEIEYTVAWIDCLSSGRDFARGLFMRGAHATEPAPLTRSTMPQLDVPVYMPAALLNRHTIGLFNTLYYHRQLADRKRSQIDYEPFFYPLDSILHWNRIYGRQGLLQFQCVLPMEDDARGITAILRTISASGLASFLAVIKVFGNRPSPGMLSFPRPGVTLALDFPLRGKQTLRLLDQLACLTQEHGGCMYPAKDALMTPRQFQSFYPMWKSFAKWIDPAFSSAFWQRVTASVESRDQRSEIRTQRPGSSDKRAGCEGQESLCDGCTAGVGER
jgi:FAD/FMN-containing dehydrogenase